MTTLIHATPKLYAHHKVAREPLDRGPKRSPGMTFQYGHSKFTDEQVTEIIYLHLRGMSVPKLHRRTKIKESTIRYWCTGVSRRKCYFAAEKKYKESIK